MLMLMSRQQVGQYQWLVVRQSPPQANNICTKTRYFKLNRGNSQKTIQTSSFQPYSASPCVMQLTSSALFFLDAHVRSPCSHPLVNSSPDSISTEVCFNNINRNNQFLCFSRQPKFMWLYSGSLAMVCPSKNPHHDQFEQQMEDARAKS